MDASLLSSCVIRKCDECIHWNSNNSSNVFGVGGRSMDGECCRPVGWIFGP